MPAVVGGRIWAGKMFYISRGIRKVFLIRKQLTQPNLKIIRLLFTVSKKGGIPVITVVLFAINPPFG
jgi:hypothetical protein